MLRTSMLGVVVGLCSLAIVSGCGGGGSGSGWTAAKQAEIDAARSVVETAIEAEAAFSTRAGKERVRAVAAADPRVEYSVVTPSGDLAVRYKSGGVEAWLAPAPLTAVPDRKPDRVASSAVPATGATRGPIGNTSAVILDMVADDPGFRRQSDTLDEVETNLRAAGMSVRRVDGAGLTLEELTGLARYGLVIYHGHGGLIAPKPGGTFGFAMCSGEPAPTTEAEKKALYDRWTSDALTIGNVEWGTTDRSNTHRSFVCATEKFFANNYLGTRFHDSMMINASCHSSQDTAFVAQMTSLGIAGYAGWTEITSRGSAAAAAMVARLTQGSDFRTAYDELPFEYRHYQEEGVTTHFSWAGDGTLRLRDAGELISKLNVTSPVNGATLTSRVVQVAGSVTGYRDGYRLSMELNGVLTRLPLSATGAFSAGTVAQTGDNTLILRLDTDQGREARVLHFTGSFAQQALWTELRWNTNGTDVDLHLLPEGGLGWSSEDCYYGNRRPNWGAELDVDDTDGFGPEHITANQITPGRYELFVHYYSTHGSTQPTTPSIVIDTGAGSTTTLSCPQVMLARHDLWRVGYLTFPGGSFQPINQFSSGTSSPVRTKLPGKTGRARP